MTDSIYIAPDIRKQKLEAMEDFINDKRVKRMIMADKYRETQLERATKAQSKATDRFDKQAVLFDNAMERVVEQIEKLSERVYKLNEINSELVNIEEVIKGEEV